MERMVLAKVCFLVVCVLSVLCAFSATAATTPAPVPAAQTAPSHAPATARGVPSRPIAGGPCAADIVRLCSTVQSGQGRKIACLHSHANGLSPRCHAMIAALDAIWAKQAAAHHETVAQFLADFYGHVNSGFKVRVIPAGASPSSSPNKAPPPNPTH